MRSHFCLFLTLVALFATSTAPDAVAAIYQTGFEASEGFILGPIDGQDGWQEVISATNPSSIIDSISYGGTQALEIAPAAAVSRTVVDTNTLVYIDSWYDAPISNLYPQLSSATPASALFVFHETDGLVGLNGDGNSGGNWVISGSPVPPGFARYTVILDFVGQIWSLYVDETLVFDSLGFKDSSVTSLSGWQIDAAKDGSGYLDDFWVSNTYPAFLEPPTPTPTTVVEPTPTPTQEPLAVNHWELY